MSPLTIVGWVDNVDLRQLSWNQVALEREVSKFKLMHGQAVVYSNVKQDKIRLVAVFYGMVVLIMPPVNPDDRISLYLKVNEFVRRFKSKNTTILNHIEDEISEAKKRLDRYEKRKQLAATATAKRNGVL